MTKKKYDPNDYPYTVVIQPKRCTVEISNEIYFNFCPLHRSAESAFVHARDQMARLERTGYSLKDFSFEIAYKDHVIAKLYPESE